MPADHLQNGCSVYSNNLFAQRVQYIESEFPEMSIVPLTKKKPYIDDLSKLLQERELDPSQVLVIDDRLTSGILAACCLKANALLLKRSHGGVK